MVVSKVFFSIAIGFTSLFVGYCIYFDHKRRHDPDYKKKLRERELIKVQN